MAQVKSPQTLLASIGSSTSQSLSGAGAVNLTSRTTRLTSTAAGNALTLATGTYAGQRKSIRARAGYTGGYTSVLTPATFADGVTITFTAVGQFVELEWQTGGWQIVASSGVTVA
jgi:hypothetical protein